MRNDGFTWDIGERAYSEDFFKNKTILVTGGCGSIGSEIVRQLLKYSPKEIRVYDIDEARLFWLDQNLQDKKIKCVVGDIKDRERLHSSMENVDVVFHAAALKHVPICEHNPMETVATNIIGTQNVVDTVIANNVGWFVGISTDKAAKPFNVMGATKLLSERLITRASMGRNTKFGCVRFGNVLVSSGSLIPTIKGQIESGNSVTITHKDMTRFFMSIDEAVQLVLKTTLSMDNGEIFIPKMSSVRIVDLIEVLIEEFAPQFGKKPKDIKRRIIGVRPGERIHESLMSDEETQYMREERDRYIVQSPLLYSYDAKGQKGKNIGTKIFEYNSSTTPLLNKKEIKKLLLKGNVFSF